MTIALQIKVGNELGNIPNYTLSSLFSKIENFKVIHSEVIVECVVKE